MKHLGAIVCFSLALMFYFVAMRPAAYGLAAVGAMFELAAYVSLYRSNRREQRNRHNA